MFQGAFIPIAGYQTAQATRKTPIKPKVRTNMDQ